MGECPHYPDLEMAIGTLEEEDAFRENFLLVKTFLSQILSDTDKILWWTWHGKGISCALLKRKAVCGNDCYIELILA